MSEDLLANIEITPREVKDLLDVRRQIALRRRARAVGISDGAHRRLGADPRWVKFQRIWRAWKMPSRLCFSAITAYAAWTPPRGFARKE